MTRRIEQKALALATEFADVVAPWKENGPVWVEDRVAQLAKSFAPVIVDALKLKGALELGTFPVRFEYPPCGARFDDAVMFTGSRLNAHDDGGMPAKFNEVRLTHRPAGFFRIPKSEADMAVREWWQHAEEQLEPEELLCAAEVSCYDGFVERTAQQMKFMRD